MGIYLDYNASTPIDKQVLNVMIDVYKNNYGNADSRTHDYGESSRKIVENSRINVAELLKIKKDEVFFTSGATESNNIAILGLQDYAEKNSKKHIITTAIEHKAVLEPINFLKKKGYEVTYINPSNSGRISAEEVIRNVREDTLLVSIMHVNNETGIIQPVKEIGEELAKQNVLFHIDAAQSFGKLVNDLQEIKYNMISASAHKMYGPQGVGALILKKKRYKLPPVSPILYGGSQEHGIRPGTLPTALIAGFGEACKIASEKFLENEYKYSQTKSLILELINQSKLACKINGDPKYCMSNTINIAFEGINSEALMLGTKHYCSISNGSACNSSSYKPSYVLEAMGVDIETIHNSVRISFGTNEINKGDFVNLLNYIKSLT